MEIYLDGLPNELVEIILFYVIGQPWKDDVRDFFSFTSTCKKFRQFISDERYWRIMSLRRDSTCDKPSETISWFDYCKQIYSQRTIPSDEIKENISRYDANYFCTIQKVTIWPNKIRIYIDERGDYSLGNIQDPRSSVIGLVESDFANYERSEGIRNSDSEFSIEDHRSQCLGYLDYPYSIGLDCIGKNLIFQYGYGGYKSAVLFHIDPTFLNKYNLMPLFKNPENSSQNTNLIRTTSNQF